jgi:putative lipoprotein
MTDDLGPAADPFFEANEGWGGTELEGTAWALLETDEGPVGLERPPTLAFGPEGEVSGLAGCNRYRGRAIIGEGTISIGPLAMTRMLCPPALAALERTVCAALEGASSWVRRDDALELSGEDGVMRLLFRRTAEGANG